MTGVRRQPPSFSYGLFLRQVNEQFRPVLGDDEIKAAAVVSSGPSPYPMIWLAAAGGSALSWLLHIAANLGPLTQPGAFWGYEAATVAGIICASIPALVLQRTMLIAVTSEQLLSSRWSMRRHRGSRVSLTRADITMITTQRRRWTTTIAITGQGTSPTRLHAIKGHRAELEQVLAAAAAAGALVDTSIASRVGLH
jgi:hypothetical protein